MNDLAKAERLDQDLSRIADRIALRGYDPRTTLRRVRRVEVWPVISLIGALALLGVIAIYGTWHTALFFAFVVVRRRIENVVARKADREALLATEDFLEHERALLERRIQKERFQVSFWLACALAFGAGAYVVPARVFEYGILVAVCVGIALFRFGVFLKPEERELRDLGGEVPLGGPGRLAARWLTTVLMLFLVLAVPFLVLAGFVYRGVRRLLGLPEKDEK